MKNTQSLLIVDDEQRVLDVLARSFQETYDVRACRNGHDALAMISERPPHVILTDQRMPGMTGLHLLREAAKISSSSVNIMLTAFSDLDDAIEAINGGLVYRYLFKPWESEELALTVRQAFEKYRLQRQNETLTSEIIAKNLELEKNLSLLKKAQEKLVLSERLSVVGQLTACIGHELRNPLSRMKTAASLIKAEVGVDNPEIGELVRIIENEVMVSEKIIHDLLGFSKDQQPVLECVDINSTVKATCERVQIPNGVRMVFDLSENIPPLKADRIQLQQVLTNLISNAIEAIEKTGSITVRTSQRDSAVEIVLEDTGKGIPEENISRVFDPLFTTRAKGIGLGMSLVKTLVERHHGHISLESKVNVGTTVRIRLPIA